MYKISRYCPLIVPAENKGRGRKQEVEYATRFKDNVQLTTFDLKCINLFIFKKQKLENEISLSTLFSFAC